MHITWAQWLAPPSVKLTRLPSSSESQQCYSFTEQSDRSWFIKGCFWLGLEMAWSPETAPLFLQTQAMCKIRRRSCTVSVRWLQSAAQRHSLIARLVELNGFQHRHCSGSFFSFTSNLQLPFRECAARLGKTLHRPVFELAGGLLTLERRENCETVKVWLRGHVENDLKKKKKNHLCTVQQRLTKGRTNQLCSCCCFFVLPNSVEELSSLSRPVGLRQTSCHTVKQQPLALEDREVCAALKFDGSPGIFPPSHSFLLSPLHVDFFPLPGREQHSEPFFSPNAAAARRDYICAELSPQMLIKLQAKGQSLCKRSSISTGIRVFKFWKWKCLWTSNGNLLLTRRSEGALIFTSAI